MSSKSQIDHHKESRGGFNRDASNLYRLDKQAVAEFIVKLGLIKTSDALILDAGTSSQAVSKALLRDTSIKHLSVLTHNYGVFSTIVTAEARLVQERDHEILITGGAYDGNYNALYGTFTQTAYQNFYPTVVVLAISGLVAGKGTRKGRVHCHAVVETSIKELLFSKPTERRIIIADHSKIGRPDSHTFGDLDHLTSEVQRETHLVTTKPLDNRQNYSDTIKELKHDTPLVVHEIEVDNKTNKAICKSTSNSWSGERESRLDLVPWTD
jgi:DeoR/GlpR family transcriptional regulator of sugar metabolism